MRGGLTLCKGAASRLRAPAMGTGFSSKLPEKSWEHVSAETRVTAARAERAAAYFMLTVWGRSWECGRN